MVSLIKALTIQLILIAFILIGGIFEIMALVVLCFGIFCGIVFLSINPLVDKEDEWNKSYKERQRQYCLVRIVARVVMFSVLVGTGHVVIAGLYLIVGIALLYWIYNEEGVI